MKQSIILLIFLLIFMQGDIRQATAPRLPDGPIEIVVPAEPSGGWDVTAQAIQSVLSKKQIVKGMFISSINHGGEKRLEICQQQQQTNHQHDIQPNIEQ